MSDSLVFSERISLSLSKNERFARKKFVVFTRFLKVFHCFFPFYAQERIALVALLSAIRSWKRANRYFALSLTNTSDSVAKTKERIPKPGLMYIFSRAPPVSTPQLTLQTELSDSIVTLFINLLRLDEKISEFVVIDAFALLLTPYTGN